MIIIIGNGISGVTAARNIRKNSSDPILIISSESKYFFSRTALMYVYMGHMKFEHTQPYEPHFWKENDIQLKQCRVEKINTENKTLLTSTGEELSFNKLILATGSKPNKFGWKGQDATNVQGLYSKQDLESMEENTKGISEAVIVGGGLIGIEMAEMLLTRNIKVHFLVRETNFWSGVLPEKDAHFIMSHFEKHHGLNMIYEDELEEILTNENNEAIGVKTKKGKTINGQFVGLTVGVSPNVDFIKQSNIDCNSGVLVNEFLETSIKDIYAIGDCAELKTPISGRLPIEQVWYTGRIMGECVAKTITDEQTTYNPGNWFNSAKFFDIEYQTYGWVKNKLQKNEAEFIYQHPKDDVLLHFIFDKNTKEFIGVNNFGIRLRHMLFNEWLNKGASIEEVLMNLKSANFDPEFYTKYEKDIVNQFNLQFNTNIVTGKTTWWQKLIS